MSSITEAPQGHGKINDVLDVIRKEGLVSPEDLNSVLEEVEKAHKEEGANLKPVDLLVQRKLISKSNLTMAIAKTLGLEFVDLSNREIPKSAAKILPPDFARRNHVIPLGANEENTTALVAVPLRVGSNIELNDRARMESGYRQVKFIVAMNDQIASALKDLYRADEELEELAREAAAARAEFVDAQEIGENEEIADESNSQRFVRLALHQAIDDGASDIIFESKEDGLLVRYRIDGRWYDRSLTPLGMADEVISVIKIQSNLDIAVRKRGQDGRMFVMHNGAKVDFRVNVFPIQDGENVTMRIIDNSQANLKLEMLGFSENNLDRFLSAIKKPQGLILVTGPTGSGKSVTLYSGLNVIAATEKNTYTIEDPIEYRIDNVKQSQIDVKSGWTYPKAIESFMRAAPDNILVGEIRNLETAHMALEAGMTGHLVLSTLHTNSAAEAAARLIDMGAEPDIVSMTLTAIVAQRLVRKLCVRCKVAVTPDPEELQRVDFPWEPGTPLPTLYDPSPTGCKECRYLGFRGRTAAHEVLLMDPETRDLVLRRASAKEIEDAAMKNGMNKILQDGFQKVLEGVTTIPEVFRSITTM